jgi:hypothetical protein
MGKVVLIEPHKVLQQAIALSLFPEHDVHVQEAVNASDIGAFGEVDLLVVDAAALREANKLSPELNRAIENSAIPTMWIEEDESNPPPKREKLAVVVKPIESAAFQSALTALLSPSSARKEPQRKAAPAKQKIEKSKGGAKKAARGRAEQSEADLIELVEVVEEEADSQQPKPPDKPQ